LSETEDASLRTVVVAVAANLFVAVAKGAAAVLTGSAAMAAETTHSIADTGNGELRGAHRSLAGPGGAAAPHRDRLGGVGRRGQPAHRAAADRGRLPAHAPQRRVADRRGAPADIREGLRQAVAEEPWVAEVAELTAVYIGPRQLLVLVHVVPVDGAELTVAIRRLRQRLLTVPAIAAVEVTPVDRPT
jgi:hypothetical protein